MRINKIFSVKTVLFLGILFTVWSCDDTSEIKKKNWQLVWADEFNTIAPDSLPAVTNWKFDIGKGPNNDGWGNAEWQTYTNKTANIKTDVIDGEGFLKIIARQDGSNFTSARIKTEGLFEQKYGRFEARMKMPYGPGIWPAFWMLGSNISTTPWPACGEIDIMEYKGQEPNRTHATIHGPVLYGGNAITQTFGLSNARFDTDFHLFAVEWDENCLDFYMDNIMFKRITKTEVESKGGTWVYDQPFFIVMNLAVCGNFVGTTVAGTVFPQTLYVDYVRVYREVN
jgi:beta-glucanase (GH16 family)